MCLFVHHFTTVYIVIGKQLISLRSNSFANEKKKFLWLTFCNLQERLRIWCGMCAPVSYTSLQFFSYVFAMHFQQSIAYLIGRQPLFILVLYSFLFYLNKYEAFIISHCWVEVLFHSGSETDLACFRSDTLPVSQSQSNSNFFEWHHCFQILFRTEVSIIIWSCMS